MDLVDYTYVCVYITIIIKEIINFGREGMGGVRWRKGRSRRKGEAVLIYNVLKKKNLILKK